MKRSEGIVQFVNEIMLCFIALLEIFASIYYIIAEKKLAKNKYLKSKITCVFFSSISVGMDPSSVIHFVKVFLQSLVYEYHFSMH